MTSILLANPFSYPVHVQSWQRPAGSLDYRVTNTYDGLDLLNGGKHRATDIGNFRQGHTVRAPATCRATGLRHFDGALGVRFDFGHGVLIELWHLDAVSSTVPIGTTVAVSKGQAVGITGDTGAKLPDGSSMPAHTHVAGKRDGVPFDVEPYLPMVERPAKPLVLTVENDDVIACRPVREQWTIPTGTEFWTEGPGQGTPKKFTTVERRWSNGESADGIWRRIEYGAEELWIRRAGIAPVAGTRNPPTGYGSAAMGFTSTQVRAERQKAADSVLEAAKTAAKTYGAT